MKLYKSLGSLIKDYRQWRQMSQEELAKSIGIGIRELQYWETDRHSIRLENLHDLSENTGIPMQVCVALNADQPIWYSVRKRRFAYSLIEMAQSRISDALKCCGQSERVLTKNCPITTDKHISKILSCHCDIYGTEELLGRDVIKKACTILPGLNRIIFDCWGHYVGHQVCLPIKKDVYEKIKKEKVIEGCLTSEKLSDIIALQKGVFFMYSMYVANTGIAYSMLIDIIRYIIQIKQKGSYLAAHNTATTEAKETFDYLGMRIVRGYEYRHADFFPTIYEIELDVLMSPLRPFGALARMVEEYNRQTGDNLNEAISFPMEHTGQKKGNY